MSETRDPNRDQPLPTKGKVAVQPYLLKILAERAEFGKTKYGTYLETQNGRNPLLDLFEELSDALVYLLQHLVEQGYTFPGVPIPEGHPAYNKTQDLIEGDGPTQDAAKAWLDEHRVEPR